jgi:hypothetical protein
MGGGTAGGAADEDDPGEPAPMAGRPAPGPGPGPEPPGGNIGDCTRVPIAFWRFDDCSPDHTDFFSGEFFADPFNGHNAFRHVNQQCVPGQDGSFAVAFSAKTDQVYAPDQPDFGLDEGVTVAAWVKPDRVDGTRTLFRKRDGNNSAFALLINGKKFQFVVRLKSGKLASVSAPARAGLWTHVAASYDNYDLRLYVDGSEVKSLSAPGVLAKGPGPLLIGNDASERRVQGLIDDAWFNTLAAPAEVINELSCVRPPPTVTVSPVDGPPVAPGTAVRYNVTVTSNASPRCAPAPFQVFASVPPEFSADPQFLETGSLSSGESAQVEIDVASGEVTDPDVYPFQFIAFGNNSGFFGQGFGTADATYTVVEPTGCHVTAGRELTIRAVSVVDDPVRTSMSGDPLDPRTGAWAFGRLMERLSPSAADAPDVTEAMFRTMATTTVINGFTLEARPGMEPQVLRPWPRSADGKLDLAAAPMRLLAIVNRLDLKNLAAGKAGEGRMVYGVLREDGSQMEFTVIFEYLLPASTEADYEDWVQSFHALQALPFPSEQYNAALQAITDRFTGRNAVPSMPNGSSLIDIRTNEIELQGRWQLREFHISPTTGFMDPVPVALSPDQSFNRSGELARFINANEATILADPASGSGAPLYDVPLSFEGEPFLGGAVFNDIFGDEWNAPGIASDEARHRFGLNTCNGCHGAETQSAFLQIFPREVGQQSFMSGFLTGITVGDPVTGEPRRFTELARRRDMIEAIVCPPDAP